MPESFFTHLFINHNKPGEANKAGGIVPMLHSFIHSANIYCPCIMGKVIAFEVLTVYKGDHQPELRAE